MRRIQYALLLAVCLIAPTMAQDDEQIIDLTGKAAKISRGQNGKPLTGKANASRPEIVSAFLREKHGHDEVTAASLSVDSENSTPHGSVHVRMRQRIAGLDVYGTYVKATLTSDGELVSVVENLASLKGPMQQAQIDYREALSAVLERHYPGQPGQLGEVSSSENTVTFGRDARFYEDPTVKRVAVPLKSGRLGVGYLVEIWTRTNQLWHTIVDGKGRLLFEELRTAGDSYNVFTNQPLLTPQVIVNGPGTGNAESTSGWITANTTTGNNVDAYLDRDNNNAADAGGRPAGTGPSGQDFLTAASLSQLPTTTANQMVAVGNLFFLNNVVHDKLYRHGFTEAAGNFQTNNFGRGGFGNDSVRAEAQDGGGTNNANFATPGDGARPRMQMYLWNTSAGQRDGDVDSDIVYHEYGHGLTWRMIGGMSGKFAGAIGEGMADTVAIYINGDDAVAEYSNNRASGIRRARYGGYPNTYSDVLGSSVHNDGEIYAATMWRLRELWMESGRTQDQLWSYVIDGMNYTPSTPAYEDMRDGILAAMPTQAEDCVVWEAFAQFGIGVGADGRVSPFRVTESFTKPAACSGPPNTAPTATITAPADGSSFAQGTSVAFAGSGSDLEQGNLTGSLVWTSNIQPGGTIGAGGSFSRSDLVVGSHTITASVTDNGGLSDTDTRTITISSAPPPNTAPTATITAPANDGSFAQGTSVAFAGSGSDLEQGNLTGSLVWTSNIQPGGTIGAGGSFSRSDLIVGTHTITASVTDAGGLTDTDIRTITITAAPAPTITLTTSGFKVKGVRNVDLTWTPTGGGTMDVYLGSSIVATTPNDGAHTYDIGGKGAGSFTFKVCLTGTTVCSNTSTVNF